VTNDVQTYRLSSAPQSGNKLIGFLAIVFGFGVLLAASYYLVTREKREDAELAKAAAAGPDVESIPVSPNLISRLQLVYTTEFYIAGRPLADDQAYKLTKMLVEMRRNPALVGLKRENIDPKTGLSELDRRILVKATAILNAKQIEVLQKDLAARTKGSMSARPLQRAHPASPEPE
jgi:hypothetical protein